MPDIPTAPHLLAEPLASFALVSSVAWQAPTLQDVADKMLLPLNDWPLKMMRVYTNILKKPRRGGAQRPICHEAAC